MKRAMPWSDEEEDLSSNESVSSPSDSEAEDGVDKKKAKDHSKARQASKERTSKVKSGKQKTGVVDFDELKRHGYKGGPSVLKVPPPKGLDDTKQDWSWSTGKESRETKEIEESYEDRQKTRAALAYGEELARVETRKEKNLSFSQKEKRKRELGQASRGKSYVEEEKRMLRESGIYSGFDT
ncbi:hypothetical protein F2P56_024625 [Juglans regia]|uniref:Uncharacterized protein LOC109018519 n=2 Tax=Juglans regia TaxID=51240 RepID=A0A2I4HJ89_JUGRE|nr:uncharacterized protein LOC109018519 [Juglans regia]KAF5455006.1 hypothetical protein F2P56_024625 [Juglans regia]